MNTQKAIERLGLRFNSCFNDSFGKPLKKNKPLYLKQEDVDAYNIIVDYYEKQQAQQLNDHHLFARLFIWVYKQIVLHYKSNVFEVQPKKHLHEILLKSTTQHVEEFKDCLNDGELYAIMDMAQLPDMSWVHLSHFEDLYKSKGMNQDDILSRLDKIKKSREEANIRLDELLKENPKVNDYMIYRTEIWDFERVRYELNNMINKAINHYQHEEN